MWGSKRYVQSWRATDNGIEAIARAHSGTCLILDELGQLGDREAGQAAYMLVNGMGKARSKKDGEARQRAEWNLTILSSGEATLADKIKSTGKQAKAGQTLRIVDISADAGCGVGIFDDVHGADPARFRDTGILLTGCMFNDAT